MSDIDLKKVLNKTGGIKAPKRAASTYSSNARYDYATYRANMKNKEFMDLFPTYRNYKDRMRNIRRDLVYEATKDGKTLSIDSPALRENTLGLVGRSRKFLTKEELGLKNIIDNWDPDLQYADKININDEDDLKKIKWNKGAGAYIYDNMYKISFTNTDDSLHESIIVITPISVP